MQPDTRLECWWRERAAELFETAPAPEHQRLESVLALVRRRQRQARSRRCLAWGAVVAVLFGVGGASAAWWAAQPSITPGTQQQPEAADEPPEPAVDGQGDSPEDDDRGTGTANDSPVIYRRSN